MKFDKEFVKKLALIVAFTVCLNSFILIDRLGVDRWYMIIPATLLSMLLATCYFNLSNSVGSEAIQKIQKDIEKNSEDINLIKTDIVLISSSLNKLSGATDLIKGQLKKLCPPLIRKQ